MEAKKQLSNKMRITVRYRYGITALIIMFLGLGSRHFSDTFPPWVYNYIGDVLWACMIFFIFRTLLIEGSILQIAVITILFTSLIEITQLYHSPWIDAIRNTRIGGLILGYTFLWTDIISYYAGILIAALSDYGIVKTYDIHINKGNN